jgi:micrococcal nuclease
MRTIELTHKYLVILILLGATMANLKALESTKKVFIYNVASIERVIDGDSIEAVLDLGFNIFYKVSIRVDGLDTPEKNTVEGKLVKAYAEEWFKTGSFVVNSKELDKYGRVLGSISKVSKDTTLDYNQVLISQGFARLYNGDKKKDWTAAELKVIREALTPKK